MQPEAEGLQVRGQPDNLLRHWVSIFFLNSSGNVAQQSWTQSPVKHTHTPYIYTCTYKPVLKLELKGEPDSPGHVTDICLQNEGMEGKCVFLKNLNNRRRKGKSLHQK